MVSKEDSMDRKLELALEAVETTYGDLIGISNDMKCHSSQLQRSLLGRSSAVVSSQQDTCM